MHRFCRSCRREPLARVPPTTRASPQQLADVLRLVQTSMDALAGAHARASGAFAAAGGHEQDGCARVGVWLRRELRLSSVEITTRNRAAKALGTLDRVRAAADAGQIRPAHLSRRRRSRT